MKHSSYEKESKPIELSPNSYRIPRGTIVTRDINGHPVSRIEDPVWHFLVTGRRRNLYFRNLVPVDFPASQAYEMEYQAREVMFYVLNENLSEPTPTIPRLTALVTILRKIISKCIIKGVNLLDGLMDSRIILSMLGEGYVKADAGKISAILGKIHRVGPLITGIKIPMGKVQDALKARIKNDSLSERQNLPLPSRLYTKLIKQLTHEIKLIETVADEVAILAVQAYSEDKFEPTVSSSLQNLLTYYERDLTKSGMTSLLGHISAAFGLAIATFSGVRAAEGNNIPFYCVDEETTPNYKDYLLKGFVTKNAGARRKVSHWVLGELGARAVYCAQRILGPLYKHLGSNEKDLRSDSHLLFCSLWNHKKSFNSKTPPTTNAVYVNSFFKRGGFILNSTDILELELIEGVGAFADREEVREGKPWRFHKHQLRRSLAIYAQSSGFVSIQSLRRQLQHMTSSLTRYYGRNSIFAKKLNFGKDHFSKEWIETQPLSSLLSFAKNILNEEDNLAGGYGKWLNSREGGLFKISCNSREETLKKMRLGEFFFTETPLGGCTNPERCEINPLNIFPFECMEKNCSKQIVSQTKLARAISGQRLTVEKVALSLPNSVQHRMESDSLRQLEFYYKRYFS